MKKFKVRRNKFDNFEMVVGGEDYKTKETIYANMPVQFKKGCEPIDESLHIFVNEDDYFFAPYKAKDGNKIKMVVLGWYYDNSVTESTRIALDDTPALDVDSDDLPF